MDQKNFEASLKVGQKIRLRYRGVRGLAKVHRVNRSSFTVLTEEVIGDMPAGTYIRVNRVVSGRWSASHCVRPLTD